MYAVVNHMKLSRPLDSNIIERMSSELMSNLAKMPDFANALCVQVADDGIVIVVICESEEALERCHQEVGSPWVGANLAPYLASTDDAQARQPAHGVLRGHVLRRSAARRGTDAPQGQPRPVREGWGELLLETSSPVRGAASTPCSASPATLAPSWHRRSVRTGASRTRPDRPRSFDSTIAAAQRPFQPVSAGCPRWDSNPHLNHFKWLASADWATGARRQRTTRSQSGQKVAATSATLVP